jgi:hypothetical protein
VVVAQIQNREAESAERGNGFGRRSEEVPLGARRGTPVQGILEIADSQVRGLKDGDDFGERCTPVGFSISIPAFVIPTEADVSDEQ